MTELIRVRGGSGLGDSIYVRPIAEHLAKVYPFKQIIPLSNHPDVFIGTGFPVEKHRKTNYEVLAHYTGGKTNPKTTQWQDVCASAGAPGVELSFAWEIQTRWLVDFVRKSAKGRPVIMVNGGRPPMNRLDGYANEMLPEKATFSLVLTTLKEQGYFIVEVGSGKELYSIPSDLDLTDKTSVSDLLDIATISNGLVGQCSFMIPLAECFDKPFLGVWAERGLKSANLYINRCTPNKIFSKPSSKHVMDNWPASRVRDTVKMFAPKNEKALHEIHTI